MSDPQQQQHQQQQQQQQQQQYGSAPVTQVMQQSLNESSGEMERGPAKRLAKKGQWATPPVGELFPAAAAPADTVNLTTGSFPVPNTSDDYTKALQEAYRRGAEAAAAMSQPATNGNGNAIAGTPLPLTVHAHTSTPSVPLPVLPVQLPVNLPVQQPVQQQGSTNMLAVQSGAVSTNMGVPTPLQFTSSMTSPPPPQEPQVSVQAASHPHAHVHAHPQTNLPQQPFYMNVDPTPIAPEIVLSAAAVGIAASESSITSNRSVSMPDMSGLDKAEDEETKRLKRLARNRASARLRRLRKKNLVSVEFVLLCHVVYCTVCVSDLLLIITSYFGFQFIG